ncbi:MAG: FadR family transcriptional regulator [Candidatus Nanopelagicales bacterium]|nr:FadR family transcriptional regulator [Candidatus Nanopelagicales bacterium]
MEMKQLQTVRTGQEVAAYLRERIACGEWGVGYRLPAQRQLAIELGVGRQAVREGIAHLEAEGYLLTRRGAQGGSFVDEPSTPVSVWRELLRANLPDMEELIDFRSAIEQHICALAALRRSALDLQAMQRAIAALPTAEMSSNEFSYSSFREADGQFHSAVSAAVKNERLTEASRRARAELFMPTDNLPYEQRVEVTRQQHTAIYQAIADGDPDAAALAARAHMDETLRNLHAIIRETDFS